MPGRVCGSLGDRNHGEVNVGINNALGSRVKRFGQRATIGAENTRISPARFEEVVLVRRITQPLDHLIGNRGAWGNDKTLPFGGVNLAGGSIDLRPQRISGTRIHAEARPRAKMHLFIHGIHGIFGQRLKMLPATQSPQTPQWCFIDNQVRPVAFTKNRPFDMGRLEFAPSAHNLAGIRNQDLRDILTATMLFGISERHINVVCFRRLLDAFHFRAVGANGILSVFGNEL